MHDPHHAIERLRERRVRTRPVGEIGALVRAELERCRPAVEAQDAVFVAWQRMAPDDLRHVDMTWTLHRGRLTLHVGSAAWVHRVLRWLRSGGETQLRGALALKIADIRVKHAGA